MSDRAQLSDDAIMRMMEANREMMLVAERFGLSPHQLIHLFCTGAAWVAYAENIPAEELRSLVDNRIAYIAEEAPKHQAEGA